MARLYAPPGRERRESAGAHGVAAYAPAVHLSRRGLKFYRDRLHFGVVCQTILAELAPDPRLLEPAERRTRVEHIVAIHPHRAGAHTVCNGMGLGDVLRPHRRRQAIHGLIRALGHFVDVLELQDGHDRPEDLLLRDLHIILHVRKHRRLDEVALVADAIAARDELRFFLFSNVDVAHHLVELVLVHLRSLLGFLVEGVAHGALFRARHALLYELVVAFLFHKQPRSRAAALP